MILTLWHRINTMTTQMKMVAFRISLRVISHISVPGVSCFLTRTECCILKRHNEIILFTRNRLNHEHGNSRGNFADPPYYICLYDQKHSLSLVQRCHLPRVDLEEEPEEVYLVISASFK